MKLRIFVSWSGPRSGAFARALTDWLPRVLQSAKPLLSKDLQKGERWSDVIGQQLSDVRVGLFCVTPENLHASWLMFEAGALSKASGSPRVCPILLGMGPSDLDGPLSQFQATVFDRADMLRLIRSLNDELVDDRVGDDVLLETFDRTWPDLVAAVQAAAAIRLDAESMHQVIRAFARYGLPEPTIGSHAFFSEGFESHVIYSAAAAIAKRRLYVFGRKNRKLFDKEHRDFFGALADRRNGGFDFRCLFLDPDAPSHVLASAHADPGFRDELVGAIQHAQSVLLEAGLNPGDCLRRYQSQRALAYAIIDDAVAYTPIRYLPSGHAVALTKSAFSVLSVSSAEGASLLDGFLDAWQTAIPIRSGAADPPR